MTTETIKADPLDLIIRIDGVIVELETHFARRNAPYSKEESALLDRMSMILEKAKNNYLNT